MNFVDLIWQLNWNYFRDLKNVKTPTRNMQVSAPYIVYKKFKFV